MLYAKLENGSFIVCDATVYQAYHTQNPLWKPFDVPSAEYLQLIEGNIEIVGAPQESPDKTLKRLESALDAYIDAQARLYRYESIRTMVTYESDPNPKFNAEGTGALKFRSACYVKSISIINDIQQGLRPIPTELELLVEMPTLESFIVYG